MQKLKPHLSVQQIAKKHNLEVSFIQKQLDMGEPIEHEHTKDHTLAMDIALQHLDEIPDYYTRLKKMENSAKREHKKFKDVKESTEEKRYCPLCDKKETRSECSYGEKTWDKVSVKDHEYSMVRSELSTMSDAIKKIQKKVGKGEGNLEAWVQSKITKAADYIDTAADYISSGEMEESVQIRKGILRASESQVKKSSGAGALTPDAAKQLGDKAIQLQKKKAAAVSLPKMKEEKLVDKILGELQEEDPCWKGYTQVGMKKKNGKEVPNCVPSKGVPKAKGYQKEDAVTIEDANGKLYAEVIDLIKPDPMVSPKSSFMANNELDETYRLPPNNGNILLINVVWRGKTYSISMFFPQISVPSRKDITDEIQKVYPGAKILTYQVSQFQPGQALIVVDKRSKNYLLSNKTIGEEVEKKKFEDDLISEKSELWQTKKGQRETGGLSKAGVNSYRRSHPGSKLQTAVTTEPSKLKKGSKSANRRKSFCSRMSGMKKKLTSAKTANDPNSRINKSLRKWNC